MSMKKLLIIILIDFIILLIVLASNCYPYYIAFSMKTAQQHIENSCDNWRKEKPEVYNLAQINKVEGFVYDTESNDLILVGQHEDNRVDLTLDDLVVALRAKFRYNEWPLVSIDPTPDTERTQMQFVRFEGGIRDTAFGQALLDADYRLKQMSMGFEQTGIAGLLTSWDRNIQELEARTSIGQGKVDSRFWFYPIIPVVAVRKGICVMRGLKIGVFTEVLSATIDGRPVENIRDYQNATDKAFAIDISEKFDKLCETQPSFNRLRGLQELVALSKALEELEYKPDLTWWIKKYPLTKTETPKEIKVLQRRYDGWRGWFEVSGGVHMVALAMRLNTGDVHALREAVLITRPSADALNWAFVAAEWIIPIEPKQENVKPDDLVSLFQQALFLQRQERHTDAIHVYDAMLALDSHLVAVWCNKGIALGSMGHHEEALQCFDRALAINPDDADTLSNKINALNNFGTALEEMGKWQEAIDCYDQALSIESDDVYALNNKGIVLKKMGRMEEALKCYNLALEINHCFVEAFYNKGILLYELRSYNEALKCFDNALEFSPRFPDAWNYKAIVFIEMSRYEESVKCANRALKINPHYADAWGNRGEAFGKLGRIDEELKCYEHVLEINPRDNLVWLKMGLALGKMNHYEEALKYFDNALEINPGSADAWCNKGVVLGKIYRYEEALKCFDLALKINPSLNNVWRNKGVALLKSERYKEALNCFDKAIEINRMDAIAWWNKGMVLHHLNRKDEAAKAISQSIILGYEEKEK